MFINAEIDRIDFKAKQILTQKKYHTIDDFLNELEQDKPKNNSPLFKEYVDGIGKVK